MQVPADLPPCPVCMGAGYWNKFTDHPVYLEEPILAAQLANLPELRDNLQRCPFCEGTGRVRDAV